MEDILINAGSLLREESDKETVMKTEKKTNPQPGKVLGGKAFMFCWDREERQFSVSKKKQRKGLRLVRTR